jgi:hypothetical protein
MPTTHGNDELAPQTIKVPDYDMINNLFHRSTRHISLLLPKNHIALKIPQFRRTVQAPTSCYPGYGHPTGLGGLPGLRTFLAASKIGHLACWHPRTQPSAPRPRVRARA